MMTDESSTSTAVTFVDLLYLMSSTSIFVIIKLLTTPQYFLHWHSLYMGLLKSHIQTQSTLQGLQKPHNFFTTFVVYILIFFPFIQHVDVS